MFKKRRGSLVQTLVLCVIMALIAAMTLKWVLSRYMLSNRAYKSNMAHVHSSGYFGYQQSMWANQTPLSSYSTILDGQTVTINCTANCAAAGKKTYMVETNPD